jgi:hypothetical protein
MVYNNRLNQELEQRKHVRIAQARAQAKASSGDDVVDGEEMRLVKDLKDAKQRYRNHFEQLSQKQKELQGLQQDVDSSKAQLVEGWQQWLGQNNDNSDNFDNNNSNDNKAIVKIMKTFIIIYKLFQAFQICYHPSNYSLSISWINYLVPIS